MECTLQAPLTRQLIEATVCCKWRVEFNTLTDTHQQTMRNKAGGVWNNLACGGMEMLLSCLGSFSCCNFQTPLWYCILAQQHTCTHPRLHLSPQPSQLHPLPNYTCRSSGCGEVSCDLCRYNPSRLCRNNLKNKYLIDDHLKAKCGGALHVVVVDAQDEQQAAVADALMDAVLEVRAAQPVVDVS